MSEPAAKRKPILGTIIGGIIFLGVVGLIIWGLIFYKDVDQSTDTGMPIVVATVPHIAIWTENIAEGAADVRLLVSGGVDVHDFSFKPADLELASSAALIAANGADLEPWLDTLEKQVPAVPVVRSSDGLVSIEGDPHTWLDPVLAIQQVQAISDELVKVLPQQQSLIARNTMAYIARLEQLDHEVASELARTSKGSFIAFHESFNYFAQRYGLEQVARLVERPGDQATLQEIQEIGNLSQELGITTLYIEPGNVPDLAEALADQFGFRLLVLDPMEKAVVSAAGYETITRQNAQVLLEGLM